MSSVKAHNQNQNQTLESRLDQVWHYINQQDVVNAKAYSQQFNQQFPNSSDGWFATSFLAFQLRDLKQALTCINKAISIAPEKARWQLHKAHTLLLQGKTVQALAITDELSKNTYQDADLCAELALILNKLSCFEHAVSFYLMAVNLTKKSDPKLAQLYFNLASVQRFLGDIDAAEHSLNKAIEINPRDYEAYLLRSSLRNQSEDKNHVNELKKALAAGINQPIHKAQVCFAMAKELEDIGSYQQSFEYLQQGANSRRLHMRYDVNNDIATIDSIIKTFDSATFNQERVGADNNEAIFILGLPRTGSTLVERILSQHSDVESAGELNNFATQMMAQCQTLTTEAPKTKLALVELTKQLNFAELGKSYIASTRPETGKSKHFIDKLPLNSLYVGLIHLALPNAKIVYVDRHPMDACYAIYKQLFTNGYPFSYDLAELARYYIAHHKLMAHWRKTLPDIIYDISYEKVVNNVELEAQGLIEYCDLDWQSDCVNFQSNRAASTTASASQVRQGIYKSSKDKWRNYEQQLSPLKQLLEQAGICCD